ncbi:helix-turn-helix domain-containing protein [Aminipila terrae]|uniref:Helix-turn-helix domain-containing protein n=1 Tax=Aminipila terrae TaxID=2697030 RepID=A0A6P1MIN4_9FIRM|nr:helix-turn-helix domain-containing protein [Aminipila terrae]
MFKIYLRCRINEIRKEIGISQAELSNRTNLTVGQISRIENNKTLPGLYTLFTLAEGLNCKIEDMYYKYNN